eukprot:scaffold105508_cov20-Tisochrysis_lutea.AAC.3
MYASTLTCEAIGLAMVPATNIGLLWSCPESRSGCHQPHCCCAGPAAARPPLLRPTFVEA